MNRLWLLWRRYGGAGDRDRDPIDIALEWMARVDAQMKQFHAASRKIDGVTRKLREPSNRRAVKSPMLAASVGTARRRVDDVRREVAYLMKQRDLEASNAAEWERRARMAVRAGNDDLARESLTRQREHAAHHRDLSTQLVYAQRILAALDAWLTAVSAGPPRGDP